MTWTFSAEEWLLDFTSTPRGRARGAEALDVADGQLRELLSWPTSGPQLVMPSIVPKRSAPRPPVDDDAPVAPRASSSAPTPAAADRLEIELSPRDGGEAEPDTGASIFIPTLTRGAAPPSRPAPLPDFGIPTDDDDDPVAPPPSRSIADDLFDEEYGLDDAAEEASAAEPEAGEAPVVAAAPEVEVEVDTDPEPIEVSAVLDLESLEAASEVRDDDTEVEVVDDDDALEAEAEVDDVASRPPPPSPPPPSPPRPDAAPPPPPRAAERHEPAPPPPPRPAPTPVEPPRRSSPPPAAAPGTEGRRRRAWYDDVFGDHYPYILPRDSDVSAELDVEFMIASARLSPDNAVLDVGCGDGRHLFALAKLGYADLMGLDFSLSQLILAARRNESQGAGLSFIHGDMRELPTDNTYDVVTCLGSTFGYFEEEQNRACLQDMVDRLNPGGKLILQVLNRDHMMSIVPCRSWWQGRGCLVLDVAEMNFYANRLRVHRTIVFEDGRQFEHHLFIRLYTINELGKMVSGMGMRVIEVSGSRETPGRFFGASSPDIWICAQRKDE